MDSSRQKREASDDSERREASGEKREENEVCSSPLATRHSPLSRNLAAYDNSSFDPGRGVVVRTMWYFLSLAVLESGWFPVSKLKCILLRLFGACVGRGVVIKPHVRIKYPWRLTVGDHVWIGQGAWIDNLDNVTLHSHCVLSQDAYLCTGSHDHRSPTFDLVTRPIVIESGAWVCARATVLAGVTVGRNGVVAAGTVAASDVPAGLVVRPTSLSQNGIAAKSDGTD